MSEHILVVEDDPKTAATVRLYLENAGYRVDSASDGEQGLRAARTGDFDLVVLDIMLPRLDGTDVCRKLRVDSAVPVIMLTARDSVEDKLSGFQAGADDYLVKPFAFSELLARVRAVLRRSGREERQDPDSNDRFEFGTFRFDPGQRVLYHESAEVDLSRAEFDLLDVFVRHPNRVLSRDFIMDCLRGKYRDPLDRSIDVRVTRLRHKIEADPADPRYVRTVWGVGYQFTPGGAQP